MTDRHHQIITAFDTPLAIDNLRQDAMLVRPNGTVECIRGGMAALVQIAMQSDREDVRSMSNEDDEVYLEETARMAKRLPKEFLKVLREQPVAHTVCIDTPGGEGSVFKVLAHAMTHSHALGGSSAVFAGRSLESGGMLIGANADQIHALRDTNILIHAPALDLDEAGLSEDDMDDDFLDEYRAEQRANALKLHTFVGNLVIGAWKRFWAKRKMRKALRDPNNHRGEVEFRATEVPGFVTKTYHDHAALAAAFAERTGVVPKTGVEHPHDRFFTLLDVRLRIVSRLRKMFGNGEVLGLPNLGMQAVLPLNMQHREADALRIVNEEVSALQQRLGQ